MLQAQGSSAVIEELSATNVERPKCSSARDDGPEQTDSE